MTKRTWRQDPVTHELTEIAPSKPTRRVEIIAPFEPFISPVTRQPVRTRAELREHNYVHKVTNTADYTDHIRTETRKRELWREGYRTSAEKEEMRHDINDAINQASSSGYVPPQKQVEELDNGD